MSGEFQFQSFFMSSLSRFNMTRVLARSPLALFEIHDSFFGNLQSFAFQKLPLQRNVGLAKQQRASCANDAMPGNTLAAWTGGHGTPNGSRVAGQFRRSRNRTVGCDSPARNFFH